MSGTVSVNNLLTATFLIVQYFFCFRSDTDFRPLVSSPSSGWSTPAFAQDKVVCNDLRDLLKSSADHNVKNLAKGGKLKEQEVRLLSHTIVDHLLQKAVEEDPKNVRVSYSTFSRWAAAVSGLFEEQLEETWFKTQRTQGGNNVVNSRRPFGKLWERYNNRKKSYTVDGRTVRRRSRSNSSASTAPSTDDGDESQPSTSSRRRKRPKEDLTSPVDTHASAAGTLILTDLRYFQQFMTTAVSCCSSFYQTDCLPNLS